MPASLRELQAQKVRGLRDGGGASHSNSSRMAMTGDQTSQKHTPLSPLGTEALAPQSAENRCPLLFTLLFYPQRPGAESSLQQALLIMQSYLRTPVFPSFYMVAVNP